VEDGGSKKWGNYKAMDYQILHVCSTLNYSHPLQSKPYEQYPPQEFVSHQTKTYYEQTKYHNIKKEHMRIEMTSNIE